MRKWKIGSTMRPLHGFDHRSFRLRIQSQMTFITMFSKNHTDMLQKCSHLLEVSVLLCFQYPPTNFPRINKGYIGTCLMGKMGQPCLSKSSWVKHHWLLMSPCGFWWSLSRISTNAVIKKDSRPKNSVKK